MNKIEPIDFEDIKDKLFESGDYLPFDRNFISTEKVTNFLISESYGYENMLATFLCKSIEDNHDKTLYEGLFRTYSINTLKKYVCNAFHFHEKQFQIKEKNGIKYAEIYFFYSKETEDNIIRAMNLGGYFPANKSIGKNSNQGIKKIVFEPKFQDELERKIKEYPYVYHITEKKNVPRIQHIGICPRSNSPIFNYPERIYLVNGDASEDTFFTVAKMLSKAKYLNFDISRYCVLYLDTDKLPSDMRLFTDPNFPGGIYTYENIHPNAISKIRNFDKNEHNN